MEHEYLTNVAPRISCFWLGFLRGCAGFEAIVYPNQKFVASPLTHLKPKGKLFYPNNIEGYRLVLWFGSGNSRMGMSRLYYESSRLSSLFNNHYKINYVKVYNII